MANRLLVRGGYVVSMDARVGDVDDADLLIEDGRIVYVGARRSEQIDAEVVDASNRIILPGFVDGHRHTWEVLLRGVSADWTLGHYYQGLRGTLARHYLPEDLYLANLLGILDGLDAGVTTTLDWCHNINSPEHADAALQALHESGSRVVFGYGNSNDEWLPISDVPHSRDATRLREQHFSSDDSLVTMQMAIRGPQYATLRVTEHDMALSRELGLRMSMSVGDGEWGRNGPICVLYRAGLMGEDVGYVHCTSLGDDELKLIADTGGVTVLSPDLEAQMWGAPATGRLLDLGVEPSLSVDCTTSISGDMFGVMRTTLVVERAIRHDAATERGEVLQELPLTARQVLRLATVAGARFCGLEDKIGTIVSGKQADLVLIAADTLAMTPLNNPVGATALIAGRGDVDAVLVRGEFVKRDWRLLRDDLESLRRRALEHRGRIFASAGVTIPGEWMPPTYEPARPEAELEEPGVPA
jgi:cytosine/adenosine deaminase-related metal-dependent hydrolase